MFYNNILVKNVNNKNIKSLSIKQLYVLYSIFNKNCLDSNFVNFNKFFVNIYLVTKNFTNSFEILFFTLLFFLKTGSVLSVNILKNGLKKTEKSNLFFFSLKRDYFAGFDIFWKKWKFLKRPFTNSGVSDYYLDDFKKKLNIYLNLGFLTVYNTYVIVKTKTNKLTPVIFNKTMVTLPKYSSSSINKNLSLTDLNNFEFQFLRKNKVYNKGRYSRTRQNYRTGVYLCMYLSVISIFGLYYWFYKFSFNFTYLWWVFIVFLGSFFFPKIVKYRLYEPTTLLTKFFDFFRWLNLLIKSLFF